MRELNPATVEAVSREIVETMRDRIEPRLGPPSPRRVFTIPDSPPEALTGMAVRYWWVLKRIAGDGSLSDDLECGMYVTAAAETIGTWDWRPG